MILKSACTILVSALVAGCAATGPGGAESDDPAPLPEEVVAIAAPWQNLATARLLPEDGCYWYEHAGPVEATMLPLRTAEGRPICAAAS